MKVVHKVGFDAAGRMTACHVTLYCDAGAYNGLSAVVAERANATALGPYRVPNVRVDTFVVYTNSLFGGAFRGFGSPQVTFAMEAQMDEVEAPRRQRRIGFHQFLVDRPIGGLVGA